MRKTHYSLYNGYTAKKENSAPISRVLYRRYLSATTAVPVIYLLRKSPCGSSVLPSIGISRAGNPQTMVYANLQPPAGTARRSPADRWSLTPPSHPYHIIIYGGCFLLPSPTVTNSFYFRKWSTLRCPDFPPVSLTYTGDKPWHCVLFLYAKVNKNGVTDNHNIHILYACNVFLIIMHDRHYACRA